MIVEHISSTEGFSNRKLFETTKVHKKCAQAIVDLFAVATQVA